MLRGTFVLALCAVVLALQVNASMIDFAKLIKSFRNSKDNSNWKFSAAYKDPLSYKVSRDVLDEFTTYVDRMKSRDTIVSLDDDTDQSKEIKFELDELRKSMGNLGNLGNLSDFEDALKPGQRPGIDCGEHGCCPDYSKADSTEKVGCAMKLCIDVFLKRCNKIHSMSRYMRDRQCRNRFIKANCPYTCNACRMPVTPFQQCQRNSPGRFCCWDGKPARGPNGLGCKPCKDKYERACDLFKHVSRGCESNAWRMRRFMNTYCPKTCGRCPDV